MQNTKEFLLLNEVRKADYHTYKRIYRERFISNTAKNTKGSMDRQT